MNVEVENCMQSFLLRIFSKGHDFIQQVAELTSHNLQNLISVQFTDFVQNDLTICDLFSITRTLLCKVRKDHEKGGLGKLC